jgi:digeranylgeranylglycerophospholipid reductase
LFDVVIVGGGPIGSRAAYQLASTGHKVGVFEKRTAIGQKHCCTGIVSQECIRYFDIPQSAILKQVKSARLFSPSGESIRIFKNEPQASILDRSKFDRDLADRAKAKGAQYFLNSRVEDISFSHEKVDITINNSSGPQNIESACVVFAGGFSSALVQRLGLGRVSYFVAGAQAEVETNGIDEVEIYFDQTLAPGYFGWLVPVSEH